MKKIIITAVCGIMLAACGEDTPKATAPADASASNAGDSDAIPTPQMENKNPAVNNNPDNISLEENVKNPATTTMTFDKTTHDFGKIDPLSENIHYFSFTNTGDVPLVINNASASCGCTVPEYPKEPIPPGEKGEIKVVFTPKENFAGTKQNKPVTITANVPGGSVRVNITADVNKK